MTDNTTLDDEIDELAGDIEQLIKEGKEVNEEFEGVFDPKHRRMEEAEVSDMSLFG